MMKTNQLVTVRLKSGRWYISASLLQTVRSLPADLCMFHTVWCWDANSWHYNVAPFTPKPKNVHHAQLWSIRETRFVYCIYVSQITAHSTMPKKYLKLLVNLKKCIVKISSLTNVAEQWWSVVVIAAQCNDNITPHTSLVLCCRMKLLKQEEPVYWKH